MKKWALPSVVIVVLAAVALVLRSRDRLPATPEAAVGALFDAAEAGDDAAYLRLLDGKLRKALVQSRTQLGTEAFRESLRRSMSGVKGLAVERRDDAPVGLAAVDVELVFADRNERQRILLVPKGSGWAITSIEAAVTVQPSIPYGTPVYEEPEAAESQSP